MRAPRSVYIHDDVWDELVRQGFQRSVDEGRRVNASELVRRGIHRELEALRGEAYELPAGFGGRGRRAPKYEKKAAEQLHLEAGGD